MKIATWNINGIKARIDAATTWLKGPSPDIACLQEIKCLDDAFPKEAFEDLGYNVAVHGQKDFNVVPAPDDVYNPTAWTEDALFRPETRAHFQALVNLGLTDAFRACHDEPRHYTFWDYQAGAWQKNQGLRIDHLLLSPQAADRLQSCEIDTAPRGWEKPSDHVPIFIELNV